MTKPSPKRRPAPDAIDLSSHRLQRGDPRDTSLAPLVRRMLEILGEDPERGGLRETPARVDESLKWLTRGYTTCVDDVVAGAVFEERHDSMVLVRDIEIYSLCEHHLLPFFGKCHIAYIPTNRVIGLSKIPRLVDVFARRLQVQERLTNQIADKIREKVAPLGVAVVMEATHLCMSMRGVEKQNSFAVTSAMAGAFRNNARTRMEFLELIKLRSAIPGLGLRDSASHDFACIADD